MESQPSADLSRVDIFERAADIQRQQRVKLYYTAVSAELARRDFRRFLREAWPLVDPKDFVTTWHIDAIAEHLVYVALGDISNLMINIPPRMTKSSTVSVAWPAWVWTDQPETQFLTASYNGDLSKADAGKMRRVVTSEWYQERYGRDVILMYDENRMDRFSNTKGGYRISISVGSKTTGLGGDIQILDDPHNAFEVESDAFRKAAINWHDNAWRSRVNDPNTARRVYVGQRTHDGDIFGHLLGKEPNRWVHLNLPMEFDKARRCITYRNKGEGNYGEAIFKDPRTKPNSLLCPARFDEKTARAEKEGTTTRTWNAQYQQQPEGAGGIILKRHWWRAWEWPEWHGEYRKSERELPEFVEIIQAYDTAFEDGEEDSFTVRSTWGLFYHADQIKDPLSGRMKDGELKINCMLLERKKWRPGFGEMLDEAVESANLWEPDRILIEKKASGHSLVKELRKKLSKSQPNTSVIAVLVKGDLVYRAHMSSYPLEKRAVWYLSRASNKDLIEECAKFPNVDFNDQVASTVIALQYMRTHMDLQLTDEDWEDDEVDLFNPKIQRGYYG